VLALGDNFYEDGISCLNDPTPGCTTDATSHRFADTFEKVYTAPSLQVPWWLNAGNHDWHTVANATAQLAYTHQPGTSKRWNFPSFYYSMNTTFTGADGAALTAQFVFIDTVILCGLSVPGGKGQPVAPADAAPGSAQLAWLTATLAASTADWLIVTGHYPVYSVAEHGSTDCLVQQVQPLLVANKVALYINGHDHNLQHIDDGTGVTYVDVGPGHDFDNDTSHAGTVPPGASKFFLAPTNGGFGALSFVNKTTLTIELYEATAPPTMVHGFAVTNPRA
jgi:tartrate-resistant acid phosphatase type 5